MKLLVLTPESVVGGVDALSPGAVLSGAARAPASTPMLRPFLDERGFRCCISAGAHAAASCGGGAAALAGRVADLARAVGAGAVLVHREAALVGPPLIEWLLTRALRRPDRSSISTTRCGCPTRRRPTARCCRACSRRRAKRTSRWRAAAPVIAGNRYIADYARRFNPRVDGHPDSRRHRPVPPAAAANPTCRCSAGSGRTRRCSIFARSCPRCSGLRARRRFVVRVVGAELDAPGVPSRTCRGRWRARSPTSSRSTSGSIRSSKMRGRSAKSGLQGDPVHGVRRSGGRIARRRDDGDDPRRRQRLSRAATKTSGWRG